MLSWERVSLPRRATDAKRRGSGKISTENGTLPGAFELGTGIFAEKGNGRKTPWVWKDFNGKWHFTRGMAPRSFLRPAVEDHIDELREIAAEEGNKEA
nr:MAG TPA: hypothetical protein [Bacteriophage sp.]